MATKNKELMTHHGNDESIPDDTDSENGGEDGGHEINSQDLDPKVILRRVARLAEAVVHDEAAYSR